MQFFHKNLMSCLPPFPIKIREKADIIYQVVYIARGGITLNYNKRFI